MSLGLTPVITMSCKTKITGGRVTQLLRLFRACRPPQAAPSQCLSAFYLVPFKVTYQHPLVEIVNKTRAVRPIHLLLIPEWFQDSPWNRIKQKQDVIFENVVIFKRWCSQAILRPLAARSPSLLSYCAFNMSSDPGTRRWGSASSP